MSFSSRVTPGGANIGKTHSRRDFINQTMGGIAFMGATRVADLTESAPGHNSEGIIPHVQSWPGLHWHEVLKKNGEI